MINSGFKSVDAKGTYGSSKIDTYILENKKHIEKFTKFDIFNLQYRLPRFILQIPYDILNKCCLLYTSPSPRDRTRSRMPSSA